MSRSRLDVEKIRRFCPSRQFFDKHALTVPAFGVASPLGAGWLVLKSMIVDRRQAAKRTQTERAAIEISRQGTASRRRAEFKLDRAEPWLRGPDLN